MRKQKQIQQQPTYRIVQRGEQFAVYDKHSKFPVICPTLADAQTYITEHSQRRNSRTVPSEVQLYA